MDNFSDSVPEALLKLCGQNVTIHGVVFINGFRVTFSVWGELRYGGNGNFTISSSGSDILFHRESVSTVENKTIKLKM